MPVPSRQGVLACEGLVLWFMHTKHYRYSILLKPSRARAGNFQCAYCIGRLKHLT